MIKFFIDTNIIIDLLSDRKPHSKFAIQLFDAAEFKKIQLFTSTHSIATTYYLLKKLVGDKELRIILTGLMDYLTLIAIDSSNIKRSLNSNHKDFEDAIQITAASTINDMNAIITRNIKDFKNSEILALSPDEAVRLL